MSKQTRKTRAKGKAQTPTGAEVDAAESQAERTWSDAPVHAESAAGPVVLYNLPDLIDVEPDWVAERDLRQLIKDWRRGRATRHVWEAIQDAYVAVFAIVMIGAMIVNAILKAQTVAAACTSVGCTDGRALLPWASFFGALALTLVGARLFGPVLASAAEGFWLFDAPIRRSRLLVRRLVAIIIGAGIVAALLSALVATLTGSPWITVVIWTITAGLGAAGLTAVAAAEQGAGRSIFVKLLQWLASGLGVAVLLVVVGVAAGWMTFPLGLGGVPVGAGRAWPYDSLTTGDYLALAFAAGALLLLIVGSLLARARLDRIHRARLLSGGSLVSGMQGAMYALDLGLMRDILVEREARERGHVKPTKGRGLGLQALVWRDAERLLRFPKPFILYFGSLVVPYAVGALGLGHLNPLISGLVLMTALVPMLGGMRVLARTKGLARMFPFSTSQLRTASMTVPGVLALIWALAIVPAYLGVGGGTPSRPLDAVTNALVTGVAGLLASVRWVTAKQVDFNTPMVSTSMGALPPGLLFNLFRGFDVTVLVTAPILLGWSPMWSAVLAALMWVILRGTFNMEEMRTLQEENKRILAAQKATLEGTNRTKQKIAPPKR